jgi:hypothetical protein
VFNTYFDALNSSLSFNEALAAQQEHLLNANTYGYQSKRSYLAPSSFGVVMSHQQRVTDLAFTVLMMLLVQGMELSHALGL